MVFKVIPECPFLFYANVADFRETDCLMLNPLSESQWSEFEEHGYLKLGRLGADQLAEMQKQIDAIMLGKASVDYDRMLMQLDSPSGEYAGLDAQTKGFKGASLDYRKIQDLEYCPQFLRYIQDPVFEEICGQVYGAGVPISLFRAMFMNKPANRGTFLPWHQDGVAAYDRDPRVTVWTALDPATKENGCLQVIPGSHKNGLIEPTHEEWYLSDGQVEKFCSSDRIVHLELEAGEVVLLDNYLLHASDKNRSRQSRRALSVCYMDAATLEKGQPYKGTRVFGQDALNPETA